MLFCIQLQSQEDELRKQLESSNHSIEEEKELEETSTPLQFEKLESIDDDDPPTPPPSPISGNYNPKPNIIDLQHELATLKKQRREMVLGLSINLTDLICAVEWSLRQPYLPSWGVYVFAFLSAILGFYRKWKAL